MTRRNSHPDDPRALIHEAYRIEGLAEADARAIFFDWALGLAEPARAGEAAARLLVHHAGEPAGHPMSALLRAAAEAGEGAPDAPRRRGRRR